MKMKRFDTTWLTRNPTSRIPETAIAIFLPIVLCHRRMSGRITLSVKGPTAYSPQPWPTVGSLGGLSADGCWLLDDRLHFLHRPRRLVQVGPLGIGQRHFDDLLDPLRPELHRHAAEDRSEEHTSELQSR